MSAPGPGGRGLSFAEGLLRRHGWSQGKGLGKKEDGISQALRVKVKCDSAGVGHNAAEQFSFHWWDHVFNESAANIAVEDGQDGVCLRTLGEQRSGISTKKPRKAVGAGSKLYGRFVKAATLTARGEEPAKLPAGSESSEEEEEEEEKLDRSSARRLTDEELVRACGGRTAHKGARHGLTMSAKLARLEEQERAFLATYQQKREQPQPAELQEKKKKKKKKKKKRAGDGAEAEAPQSCEPSGEEEVEGEEEKVVKRKKKKKKEKEELAEAELPLEEAEGAEQAEHGPKKKKRKKKRREEE